jgi:hypothetical protein
VASDRQIAANRANAKKSTGPRTAEGKLISSQNARRHRLSAPRSLDELTSARAESLACAVMRKDADASQLKAAKQFAHAQLELERIKLAREALMALLNIEQPELDILQDIAALDRYERYAFTRSRRAIREL